MLTVSKSDRTWPVPSKAWVMKMQWHDLLFMHYRVDVSSLRPQIPGRLQIDRFDGDAWIGIVPFRMTGVAPRMIPPMPWISSFPELNVRTYVTIDGKPGVWFFSLDATNPLAVRFARKTFHLNYLDASIRVRHKDRSCDGTWIGYQSKRTHRNQPSAVLDCEYRPIGVPYRANEGTLEHFLTARYCLYAAGADGTIYRGDIDHEPWQLQHAQCIVHENTMFNGLDLHLLNGQPTLHFAKRVAAKAWFIEPV